MNDLFFRSKIEATARVQNKEVHFTSGASAIRNATLVLVDLEFARPEDLSLILKNNPLVQMVGFASHKNAGAFEMAKHAGIHAMPRSLFTQKISDLLEDK
ncbi:MAG: hypothetical protein AABY11_00945 [archaeon]